MPSGSGSQRERTQCPSVLSDSHAHKHSAHSQGWPLHPHCCNRADTTAGLSRRRRPCCSGKRALLLHDCWVKAWNTEGTSSAHPAMVLAGRLAHLPKQLSASWLLL